MAKSPRAKRTIKEDKYELSLSILGEKFTSAGKTPFEALHGLQSPKKLMGKGVLTVKKGDYTREVLMMPTRLKRMFYKSPVFQEIFAKQLFAGLVK